MLAVILALYGRTASCEVAKVVLPFCIALHSFNIYVSLNIKYYFKALQCVSGALLPLCHHFAPTLPPYPFGSISAAFAVAVAAVFASEPFD